MRPTPVGVAVSAVDTGELADRHPPDPADSPVFVSAIMHRLVPTRGFDVTVLVDAAPEVIARWLPGVASEDVAAVWLAADTATTTTSTDTTTTNNMNSTTTTSTTTSTTSSTATTTTTISTPEATDKVSPAQGNGDIDDADQDDGLDRHHDVDSRMGRPGGQPRRCAAGNGGVVTSASSATSSSSSSGTVTSRRISAGARMIGAVGTGARMTAPNNTNETTLEAPTFPPVSSSVSSSGTDPTAHDRPCSRRMRNGPPSRPHAPHPPQRFRPRPADLEEYASSTSSTSPGRSADDQRSGKSALSAATRKPRCGLKAKKSMKDSRGARYAGTHASCLSGAQLLAGRGRFDDLFADQPAVNEEIVALAAELTAKLARLVVADNVGKPALPDTIELETVCPASPPSARLSSTSRSSALRLDDALEASVPARCCGFAEAHADIDILCEGLGIRKTRETLYRTARARGSARLRSHAQPSYYFEVHVVEDVGRDGMTIGLVTSALPLNKLVGSDTHSVGLHSSGQLVTAAGAFQPYAPRGFSKDDRVGCLVSFCKAETVMMTNPPVTSLGSRASSMDARGSGPAALMARGKSLATNCALLDCVEVEFFVNRASYGSVRLPLLSSLDTDDARALHPAVSLYGAGSKAVIVCCEEDWDGLDDMSQLDNVNAFCDVER